MSNPYIVDVRLSYPPSNYQHGELHNAGINPVEINRPTRLIELSEDECVEFLTVIPWRGALAVCSVMVSRRGKTLFVPLDPSSLITESDRFCEEHGFYWLGVLVGAAEKANLALVYTREDPAFRGNTVSAEFQLDLASQGFELQKLWASQPIVRNEGASGEEDSNDIALPLTDEGEELAQAIQDGLM